MKSKNERSEAREWAEREFGEIELGDVRREERAVMIAAAMAANPNKSLPEIFSRRYDLKATYTFFRHERVVPDEIQAGHREKVVERMKEGGNYLLIEDTSEMSWCGNKAIEGLGPIGEGKAGMQGFHLHTTLAVVWAGNEIQEGQKRPPVEILGIADQQYNVRKKRPAGEKEMARKNRERESQWWEETSYRIGEAPDNEESTWVRVCDRGADAYETMVSCEQNNHRYVIRAAQDRSLTDEQGHQQTGKLFETARQSAPITETVLKLRARAKQPARTARLNISVTSVWLRSPQRPGKRPGCLKPIKCNVVRIWEPEPPPGIEALEWILLTDLAVDSPSQALEIGLMYSTRWLIEDFHKALKTGTKAEQLQLETVQGLFAAIAFKSIVALRLIDLRERLRIAPDAAAEESGLSEIELKVLKAALRRPISTVRDVALGLGRLGGHLNRKADGLPGWQTLWRGMSKLNSLVEGALLAIEL